MAKVKERILDAEKEKQKNHIKGTFIRSSANFYAEILQTRREWHNTIAKREKLAT